MVVGKIRFRERKFRCLFLSGLQAYFCIVPQFLFRFEHGTVFISSGIKLDDLPARDAAFISYPYGNDDPVFFLSDFKTAVFKLGIAQAESEGIAYFLRGFIEITVARENSFPVLFDFPFAVFLTERDIPARLHPCLAQLAAWIDLPVEQAPACFPAFLSRKDHVQNACSLIRKRHFHRTAPGKNDSDFLPCPAQRVNQLQLVPRHGKVLPVKSFAFVTVRQASEEQDGIIIRSRSQC